MRFANENSIPGVNSSQGVRKVRQMRHFSAELASHQFADKEKHLALMEFGAKMPRGHEKGEDQNCGST
jgi:hypothetical protein